MVRLAAIGDLHMRHEVCGRFRPALAGLSGRADMLLLAGDLTNGGTAAQAEMLCQELAGMPVPVIAVLGNHDHDEGNQDDIAAQLRTTGVHVLDGDAVTIEVDGTRVGVAGVMGGGGGFPGTLTAPGDATHGDDLLARGPQDARRLHAALDGMDCDLRIALTHFAPVPDTLEGEPRGLYPVLGCSALGEAIDGAAAQLAIHGHAHLGSEHGRTPGGIPVRNVAHPVLRRPYAIYELPDHTPDGGPGRADA